MENLIKRVQELKQDFDPNLDVLIEDLINTKIESEGFIVSSEMTKIISENDKKNFYGRYEDLANEISLLHDDLFKEFTDTAVKLGLINVDHDGWDFTF